jgi:hypothetical protein
MKILNNEELIAMAKAHGLLAEQAEPINRTGQDTATNNLPPYDADKKREWREVMMRRLHTILDAHRERLARNAVVKEGWSNMQEPVASNDEPEDENKRPKLMSFKEFRKKKVKIEINPSKEGLSNSRI